MDGQGQLEETEAAERLRKEGGAQAVRSRAGSEDAAPLPLLA